MPEAPTPLGESMTPSAADLVAALLGPDESALFPGEEPATAKRHWPSFLAQTELSTKAAPVVGERAAATLRSLEAANRRPGSAAAAARGMRADRATAAAAMAAAGRPRTAAARRGVR